MAQDYDALQNELADPKYKGMAWDEAAAAINAATGPLPIPALITPDAIVATFDPNEITVADPAQIAVVGLMLRGSQVNLAPDSKIRAFLLKFLDTMSASKASFAELLASYDEAEAPLPKIFGFGRPLDHGDIKIALGVKDDAVAVPADQQAPVVVQPVGDKGDTPAQADPVASTAEMGRI